MTRTTAREIAIQLGFAAAATGEEPSALLDRFFDQSHYATLSSEDELYRDYPDEAQLGYIRRLISLMDEHREEIDDELRLYLKGCKLERLSKTALAVLRTALCEIQYMEDIPDAAAINEAVELAKGYDDPDTVSFINGVLGSFMRARKKDG